MARRFWSGAPFLFGQLLPVLNVYATNQFCGVCPIGPEHEHFTVFDIAHFSAKSGDNIGHVGDDHRIPAWFGRLCRLSAKPGAVIKVRILHARAVIA